MKTPLSTSDPRHLSTIALKKYLLLLLDKGVLAKVNLGSPSKNCLGVGICKIDLLSLVEQDTSLLPCSSIAILKKYKKDRLSIHFKIDSLSSKAMKVHFQEGTFIVEENYTLPNRIVQLVGCRPKIFKGFYQIEKTKDSLIVYL